jgi:serine protease inhibitor ecotin
MKTNFSTIAIALFCIQFTNSYAALDSDWDTRKVVFPTVANGMARAELYSKLCNGDNSEYKAEVVIEKDLLLDDRREYWLKLDIQHKYVERSTYEYYEISKIELVSSKPDKTKNSEEILRTIKSRPFEINCNRHKSPLVIYLPYGYTVNYRIWTSSKNAYVVSPGMMLRSPSESSPPR